jgi:hypothetical protein
MKVAHSSETSVYNKFTQRHFPEDMVTGVKASNPTLFILLQILHYLWPVLILRLTKASLRSWRQRTCVSVAWSTCGNMPDLMGPVLVVPARGQWISGGSVGWTACWWSTSCAEVTTGQLHALPIVPISVTSQTSVQSMCWWWIYSKLAATDVNNFEVQCRAVTDSLYAVCFLLWFVFILLWVELRWCSALSDIILQVMLWNKFSVSLLTTNAAYMSYALLQMSSWFPERLSSHLHNMRPRSALNGAMIIAQSCVSWNPPWSSICGFKNLSSSSKQINAWML